MHNQFKNRFSKNTFHTYLNVRNLFPVLVVTAVSACLPTDEILTPTNEHHFQNNTGVVTVQPLSEATSVCYTVDGSEPVWNEGSCNGGTTMGIVDPSIATEILLECGEDTGADVLRTVRLEYDSEDETQKLITSNYYLNCDVDADDDGSGDSGQTDDETNGDEPTATNSLTADTQIETNEYLESSNGRYRLFMQSDGNLVLRDWDTRESLWSSSTHGTGAVRARFQGDGNFVIRTADGSAVWSSGTNGSGGDRLVLNNDGSLAIYSGNTVVWAVNGDGNTNTGGGNDGGSGDGGDSGGGNGGDDPSSLNRFSTPSAALYSLNNSKQRVFPEPVSHPFGGNGHSVTWDGRVYAVKRTGGWFAAAFRPERISLNSDGTPNFNNGAFGDRITLELEEDAGQIHQNWLAIVKDPSVSGENPYPSNSNGSYQANGTFRTYKALIYQTSTANGDNDQMGYRAATFIVSNANTSNAQLTRAEFDGSFRRLALSNGDDFRCIEPSATMDGRLIICQGHPDNNGRIDNLVYSWHSTPGATTNWPEPKSIANLYYDERNKDVDGIPFAIRYPLAERPLLDASGEAYTRGQLVKGAYPWVSRDGSELFYQAAKFQNGARRSGTTVVGRWSGWTFRHIDGPINADRDVNSKLFISSPGAFTTMWTPFKDVADLPIPYSLYGPVYPLFGSNSQDYNEIGFDDYLDGNYVMYLGMNEQLDRAGEQMVNNTPDTSGNFNNAQLVGAKFPVEYNGDDEIVGRNGQAIYFPSDTYLSVDKNQGWSSLENAFTVDLFVRKFSGSGDIPLFSLQNGVEVYLDNGAEISASMWDNQGQRVDIDGPNILNERWTHVALSFDSADDRLRLFVDGSQVSSVNATAFGDVRTSGQVRIGPDNANALLILDDVKVSNVARTGIEIAHTAYSRTHRPPSSQLMSLIPGHLQSLSNQAIAVDRFSMEAAALGEELFNDVILSKERTTSCATCHDPELAFTDGLAIAQGDEPTDAGERNTPTLLNRLFSSLQGWSGTADSLDVQALIPVAAVHEMNLPISEALQRLRTEGDYAQRFQDVYGEAPDEFNFPAALASFQAVQFAPITRVDQYKAGDDSALTESEQRGLRLFEGKARCSGCHSGTNFTDESFRNNGLVDNGDIGRADATARDRDFKLFKVPTLRGLNITGPFMHDGSMGTLQEVVSAYNDGANDVAIRDTDIRPLELSSQEQQDLVAFLMALSEPGTAEPGNGDDGSPTREDATSANSLGLNQRLNSNEYLESTNGDYRLYLQGDGNLVLRDTDSGSSVWSSSTVGTGAVRLTMQSDGNLVMRDSEGDAIWSTRTSGSGANLLLLESGGSLILYEDSREVLSLR